MNSENELAINITAIDEASDVLLGVSDAAEGMSQMIGEAVGSINQSMEGMAESFTKSVQSETESIAELENIMANSDAMWAQMEAESSAAADGTVAAMERMAEIAGTTVGEIEANFEGVTAAAAYLNTTATETAASFESDLGAMAVAAATSAGEIESSMDGAAASTAGVASKSSIGLLGLGAALGIVGKPLKDFYDSSVAAGMASESAAAVLTTSIQNLITQGKDLQTSDGSVSQEKQYLIDKINAEKTSIMALEAPISGHNKTTEQLAVAHAQAAAEVQTHNDTLAQLEGQLDRFNNVSTMAASNSTSLTKSIEDQAKKNMDLGFSYTDSVKSLTQLTAETGDVKHGIEANAAAMELARFRNEDLTLATNQVAQAYNGQGRSLSQVGIIIKDGLAGNASLKAISEQTGNALANSNDTLSVSIDKLDVQWNHFMTDLGGGQKSALQPLIQTLTDIVKAFDSFAERHPVIASAFMQFIGIAGTLAVVLGGALLVIGLFTLAGIGAAAAMTGLGIVVFAASVAITTYIIEHFSQIVDWLKWFGGEIWKDMKAAWDGIISGMNNIYDTIFKDVETGFNKIFKFLQDLWKSISDTILGTIKSISDAIDGFISKIGDVLKSIAKLPGNIVSGIGSGISNTIHAFADGGIVTSPQLALVGEAGPEAIIPLSAFAGGAGLAGAGGGNGGGGITINMNIGNMWGNDQNMVRRVAQELARTIGQQIKLTNFS